MSRTSRSGSSPHFTDERSLVTGRSLLTQQLMQLVAELLDGDAFLLAVDGVRVLLAAVFGDDAEVDGHEAVGRHLRAIAADQRPHQRHRLVAELIGVLHDRTRDVALRAPLHPLLVLLAAAAFDLA